MRVSEAAFEARDQASLGPEKEREQINLLTRASSMHGGIEKIRKQDWEGK